MRLEIIFRESIWQLVKPPVGLSADHFTSQFSAFNEGINC